MRRFVLCFLLLAFAWTGCSDDPVSPPDLVVNTPPAPLETVPLSVGDTWVHRLRREQHIYNQDRTQEIFPPAVQDAMSFKEIVGTETIVGLEYVTEREVFVLSGIDSTVRWRRFRQDESGFYRAALRLGWAFGNLPPLQSVEEFRRLSYPVEIDATWETNDRARRATVEALEEIETADGMTQAFRVRVDTDDPDDLNWVLLWYSPCGLVRRHDHQAFFANDVGNNTIVLIEFDEVEEIEAATLTEGGCMLTPLTE